MLSFTLERVNQSSQRGNFVSREGPHDVRISKKKGFGRAAGRMQVHRLLSFLIINTKCMMTQAILSLGA
jgi:hypothetical protein